MAQRTEVPEPKQLTLAGKALIFSSALLYIIIATALGATLFGSSITPLAVYLVGRTIIQTRRSRRNLKKSRAVTRPPYVEAIKQLFPDHDWTWLETETKKSRRYSQWRGKIWEHPPFAGSHPEDLWKQVVEASFAGYEYLPRVGAVVPCYGIQPEEIRATLQSLEDQSYPFSYVAVVLNEPGNQAAREAIQEWCAFHNFNAKYEKWHFIDRDRPGKRAAMAAGYRLLEKLGVDFSINVDGDTVADIDALANTVRVKLEVPDCHLITSNVRIKGINRRKLWGNLLKLWTFFRYDYANNVERAAQTPQVNCGSGPWLSIRTLTLSQIIEEFLAHTYKGAPVRPGDDRFLTRLLNRRNLGCYYVPDIIVWTDSPSSWGRLRSQQSRWAQSAEIGFEQQTAPIIFSPKAEIWKLRPWSISDTLYLGLFAYIIFGVFLRLGYEFVNALLTEGLGAAIARVLPYAIAFGLSNLWRRIYSALTNDDILGMVNAFYFIPLSGVVLPERFKRKFNLSDGGWGGRVEAPLVDKTE